MEIQHSLMHGHIQHTNQPHFINIFVAYHAQVFILVPFQLQLFGRFLAYLK